MDTLHIYSTGLYFTYATFAARAARAILFAQLKCRQGIVPLSSCPIVPLSSFVVLSCSYSSSSNYRFLSKLCCRNDTLQTAGEGGVREEVGRRQRLCEGVEHAGHWLRHFVLPACTYLFDNNFRVLSKTNKLCWNFGASQSGRSGRGLYSYNFFV